MSIYTPGVDLEASPWGSLQVRGGWEADVVSGASVPVKAGAAYQANHANADVITAASVNDLRNQGHGGFTLKSSTVSLSAGYVYSTENDYRSNAFNVAARTDLFQHDTQLEIAYARNFDQVCDRSQVATATTTQFIALESHDGCFTSSASRVSLPIDIDGFQGSWTQAITPIFTTQLVYTGQIINGFQGNPYRSVILADGVKASTSRRTAPGKRLPSAGTSSSVRSRRRFGSVFAATGTTWSVSAGDVEAELEKYLGDRSG